MAAACLHVSLILILAAFASASETAELNGLVEKGWDGNDKESLLLQSHECDAADSVGFDNGIGSRSCGREDSIMLQVVSDEFQAAASIHGTELPLLAAGRELIVASLQAGHVSQALQHWLSENVPRLGRTALPRIKRGLGDLLHHSGIMQRRADCDTALGKGRKTNSLVQEAAARARKEAERRCGGAASASACHAAASWLQTLACAGATHALHVHEAHRVCHGIVAADVNNATSGASESALALLSEWRLVLAAQCLAAALQDSNSTAKDRKEDSVASHPSSAALDQCGQYLTGALAGDTKPSNRSAAPASRTARDALDAASLLGVDQNGVHIHAAAETAKACEEQLNQVVMNQDVYVSTSTFVDGTLTRRPFNTGAPNDTLAAILQCATPSTMTLEVEASGPSDHPCVLSFETPDGERRSWDLAVCGNSSSGAWRWSKASPEVQLNGRQALVALRSASLAAGLQLRAVRANTASASCGVRAALLLNDVESASLTDADPNTDAHLKHLVESEQLHHSAVESLFVFVHSRFGNTGAASTQVWVLMFAAVAVLGAIGFLLCWTTDDSKASQGASAGQIKKAQPYPHPDTQISLQAKGNTSYSMTGAGQATFANPDTGYSISGAKQMTNPGSQAYMPSMNSMPGPGSMAAIPPMCRDLVVPKRRLCELLVPSMASASDGRVVEVTDVQGIKALFSLKLTSAEASRLVPPDSHGMGDRDATIMCFNHEAMLLGSSWLRTASNSAIICEHVAASSGKAYARISDHSVNATLVPYQGGRADHHFELQSELPGVAMKIRFVGNLRTGHFQALNDFGVVAKSVPGGGEYRHIQFEARADVLLLLLAIASAERLLLSANGGPQHL